MTRRYKRRMDIARIVVVIVRSTFVLAGFVKGVIGLGLPTVANGASSPCVMTPAQAVALLVVPSFATNVWQAVGARTVRCCAAPGRCCSASASGPGVSGCLGRACSRPTTARAPRSGSAIVLALYGVARPELARQFSVPARLEPVAVAADRRDHRPRDCAATGVRLRSRPAPYLQALGLAKEDDALAIGLSFTGVDLGACGHSRCERRIADVGRRRPAAGARAGAAAAWCSASGWGRVSPRVFRTCFFAGFADPGAHLVLRALV